MNTGWASCRRTQRKKWQVLEKLHPIRIRLRSSSNSGSSAAGIGEYSWHRTIAGRLQLGQQMPASSAITEPFQSVGRPPTLQMYAESWSGSRAAGAAIAGGEFSSAGWRRLGPTNPKETGLHGKGAANGTDAMAGGAGRRSKPPTPQGGMELMFKHTLAPTNANRSSNGDLLELPGSRRRAAALGAAACQESGVGILHSMGNRRMMDVRTGCCYCRCCWAFVLFFRCPFADCCGWFG